MLYSIKVTESVGASTKVVHCIVHKLDYTKVCAQWIFRLLPKYQKSLRMGLSSITLQSTAKIVMAVLFLITAEDEIRCHYFEPSSRMSSMQRKYLNFLRSKKFKAQLSVDKMRLLFVLTMRDPCL